MIRILKKFNTILSKKQKNRILIIIILMIIGALLETLGVSLVVPLMTALMQEDFMQQEGYVSMVCSWFGIQTTREFLLLSLVSLIVVFIVKDAFLYFEYYVQIRFICNNKIQTQRRLMEAYMSRPYEYYLSANSGEIMRVVKSDTGGTYTLLTTVMSFFTEAIVSFALIVAIIVVDPCMAFLVSVLLALVILVIYKVVKPVLRKAGEMAQENNAISNKWILQSVAGIKELKVARKEAFFVGEYSKYAKIGIDADRVSTVLSNAPRLIIEAVVVSGMLGFMTIQVYNGREVNTLLPQLSAFAVAAVRLLPSANRMSVAINNIAYYEPQLDKTIENLKILHEYENAKKMENQQEQSKVHCTISLEKECQLKNVEYCYPNCDSKVLDNAGMIIPIGKSVGIIGASGAGKTTAVDVFLGLLSPQSGEVLADGVTIQADYSGWLERISYIPQIIYMLDDTIRANVAFGIPNKEINDAQIWKALEEAQLGDFVRSLPDGLDTEIGERGVRVSGGQRQRLGIARALYTNPELIILDEATSALDTETETAIMESVNSLHGKKTLVIIAHRLSTIEECDIVYRVENGKIEKVR